MSDINRRGGLRRRIVGLLAALVTTLSLVAVTEAAANADPACGVLAQGASQVADAAVNFACAEVNKQTPYVWGGGHGAVPGPTGGGLDCSGLARWAYAQATGADPIGSGATWQEWQYLGGTRFSASAGLRPLLPGDLLYWSSDGTASGIHHVAIYIGNGYIAEEPDVNLVARVHAFYSSGYFGAIRPFPGGSLAMGSGNHVNSGIDDVSGDGHADLLWSDGASVNYLPNNSGSNQNGVPFQGTSNPVVQGLPAGALVAAGSITGHNTADLFIYDPALDEVRLYPGAGGGAPYSGTGWVVATQLGGNVSKIFAADLTGDGYADLVYTKTDGTAYFLPNNMGGNAEHLPFAGEGAVQIVHGLPADAVVAMGDLNHDGYADLLYTSGGNLYALMNNIIASNGNPYPEAGQQINDTDGAFGGVTQMTAADVSGDGVADLLWLDANGEVNYLPNNFGSNPNHVFFAGPSQPVASLGTGHTLI